MLRGSRVLLKEMGITEALSDFLACPLSKQPLRLSPETDSLISAALGASYPGYQGILLLSETSGEPSVCPTEAKCQEMPQVEYVSPVLKESSKKAPSMDQVQELKKQKGEDEPQWFLARPKKPKA